MKPPTKSKTADWFDGFTTALVFLSDIFESRSKAFVKKKLLSVKDVRFIVSVIDAAIAARGRLCDIGPRKMNLVLFSDGHCEFQELKEEKKDGSP